MKFFSISFSFISLVSSVAYAQADTTTSKIALLFDSPLFFGSVITSAAILLAGAFWVIFAGRSLEKKAIAWGQGKSISDVIDLLSSPVKEEAQLAYVFLSNHVQEKEYPAVIASLEKQRDSQKINPRLVHLVEDLDITPGMRVLETIAKGKTEMASLAAQTLSRMQKREETCKGKK